ncbi:hypothetical protein CBE79_03995 [Priestia megaterium]|nr:hypothetical protein CBE78_01490 [Priestia megaterium]TPF22030.1 hypothetical protein CBE79_03995 [Priestia megaterium]
MYVLHDQNIKKNSVKMHLKRNYGDQVTFAYLHKDAYDVNVTFKLTGELNELTFSLPFKKSIHNVLKKPQSSQLIQEFHLIRFVYMKIDEMFIVKSITNEMTDSGDSKKVTAVHLPYELTYESVRSFNQSGLNCRQVLEGGAPKRDAEGNILTDAQGNPIDVGGILAPTNWTVGTIDADFEISTRTFDWDEASILDAIYQIAETYDAIATFDTSKRKVNIVKSDSIGSYQNFIIGYGKYAQSINQTTDIEEVFSRVKATGRDGLTFSSINPTGLDYIDDFSYFMHPFVRDSITKQTLQSAVLMPDDLCHAILDYQELIESKSGILTKLFKDLDERQKVLDERTFELSNLEIELKTIDDNLEIAKALQKDLTNLNLQRNAKQKEVDDKRKTVADLETLQANIRTQIKTLQEEMSTENNFTEEQIRNLKKFTKVKTFSDDKCITPEDLLKNTKEEMERVKYPQLTVTTDIVNLYSILTEHRNWNRLNLGDTVRIRYEEIGIDVKARVTEISFNFESETITLIVSNAKRTDNKDKKILNTIQQASSTTTSVSMNKSSWGDGNKALNKVLSYIDSELDTTKQKILAGVNNSVIIDGKGITTTSPDSPNDVLIIQAGRMAISNNRSQDWQIAIDAKGVVADRLYGKILAGANLTIDATDNDGIHTFTVDGKGVKLNGMSLQITGENNENLMDSWNKSIKQGSIYNGVKIDLADGLTVERSDAKVKSVLNATDGFSMQHKAGTEWIKKFWLDTDGNVQAKDMTVDRLIIRNGDKVLVDGITGVINYDNFTVQNGKIPAANIDLDITKIGVTDANITGTISGWKLDLSNNLKGTTVTDINGNVTFSIDTEGKVSIPSQSSGTSFNNAIFTGLTTVRDNLTVGGLLDLSESRIKWNPNIKGVGIPVPPYEGSVRITGLDLTNLNYGVNVSPLWRTAWWISDKTVSGFTVNFSIPSEVPVSFDWFLF